MPINHVFLSGEYESTKELLNTGFSALDNAWSEKINLWIISGGIEKFGGLLLRRENPRFTKGAVTLYYLVNNKLAFIEAYFLGKRTIERVQKQIMLPNVVSLFAATLSDLLIRIHVEEYVRLTNIPRYQTPVSLQTVASILSSAFQH